MATLVNCTCESFFKIGPRWIPVSKSCDFNDWIHWFRVDGRPRGRYPAKQAYFSGINLGFWETAHLPLPGANINTYFSLGAK